MLWMPGISVEEVQACTNRKVVEVVADTVEDFWTHYNEA